MSRQEYENFGKLAAKLSDYIIISGRYKIQEAAEKYILADIINKLEINSSDSVLEIGCGAGNILIPLSFMVNEITGIDHPSCIELLKRRFPGSKNINYLSGNFLDISLNKIFNKILCYSVLHYLADEKEVIVFIDKAIKLLSPGGIALFGDIPNTSTKGRFLKSKRGEIFNIKWRELLSKNENIQKEKEISSIIKYDPQTVLFNDDLVFKILKRFREKNFNAYILSQPSELPFGNTREDIIICKLA